MANVFGLGCACSHLDGKKSGKKETRNICVYIFCSKAIRRGNLFDLTQRWIAGIAPYQCHVIKIRNNEHSTHTVRPYMMCAFDSGRRLLSFSLSCSCSCSYSPSCDQLVYGICIAKAHPKILTNFLNRLKKKKKRKRKKEKIYCSNNNRFSDVQLLYTLQALALTPTMIGAVLYCVSVLHRNAKAEWTE